MQEARLKLKVLKHLLIVSSREAWTACFRLEPPANLRCFLLKNGILCPNPRLCLFFVDTDIRFYCTSEFGHTSEAAALYAAVCQFGEPSLHHIHPRRTGRSEVHVETAVAFLPPPHFGCLVCAQVVQHHMDIRFPLRIFLHHAEE